MSAIIDAIAKRNAAIVPGGPVRQWAKLAGGGLAMSDPMGGMVMESVNTVKCCAQFVVSTTDIDRSGDIVLPRGCQEYLSEYEKNPIVCIDHREKFTMPPAQALDENGNFGVQVFDDRITSWVKFHLLTEESRDFCALVMEKVLRGASVCFLPLMAHPNIQQKAKEDERDTQGHVYSKWRFLEWSICVLQDNQNALQMCLSKGRVGDHKLESEAVKKTLALSVPEPRRDARRPSQKVHVSKSLAQRLPLAYDRGNSRGSEMADEVSKAGRAGLVLDPTTHRWVNPNKDKPGGKKPAAKPSPNAQEQSDYYNKLSGSRATHGSGGSTSKPVEAVPSKNPHLNPSIPSAWSDGKKPDTSKEPETAKKPGILQRIGSFFTGKKAMKAIAYIEADSQEQIDKFVRKHLGGVTVCKAESMSEADGPSGGMAIEHDTPDDDDVVPGAKAMADHLAMCAAHKDMVQMHKDVLCEHAPKQENEEMKKFHNKAMDDLDAHHANLEEMHEEAKSKAAELYPDHDFGEGNKPKSDDEEKDLKDDLENAGDDKKPKEDDKKTDDAAKEYTDGTVEAEAGKKEEDKEEKKKSRPGIVRRMAVKKNAGDSATLKVFMEELAGVRKDFNNAIGKVS